MTQGFPGSPSPKEAPREDPKWLKQRSSDRMGPLGASRRPSRAADMRPERTTRRKTCVLRVCCATQDPLMWPKLAQVGPGIALLGGFQGLLGALWGRLGAGNAPGSATAAPGSPWRRKNYCFLVFSGGKHPLTGTIDPRPSPLNLGCRAPH